MAAIELFKTYAMDYTCERDIFRTISPIYLKFCFHITSIKRTDVIDFGLSAKKTIWPPLNFLNCMLWTTLLNAISLEPFTKSTLYMKFVVKFSIDFGPSAKNKMAAIELFFKVCYMDKLFERDIFRII